MDASTRTRLIQAAIEARDRAYCPYSHFPVGAALLCDDGAVVPGCNVENAAFSPSICAERAAVASAVSQGWRAFDAIAIVGHDTELIPPCGVCRQTLAEFAPDLLVILSNARGDHAEHRLSDLLPHSFDPAHVKR